MSKPRTNPFRDMPFPSAGGAWRCSKGALVPEADAPPVTPEPVTGDVPAAPRKAGKTTEPQE